MQAEWAAGLAGGLMIGAAAVLLLWGNGRIMGASGILGGAVDGSGRADLGERAAFLAGLVGAPLIVVLIRGGAPQITPVDSPVLLILAGLLVGFGTRLANGCTSGHGVCGISRLSRRGIAATVAYLAAGGISLLAVRHLLGLS
ncbi:YeeE/YedE family protein [Mangrovicoccus algicola]|uniref:YeeE/YedE family protein n=1 Tax=Mangrovicoccus algicola TaxID=2771008 RepID=A0A8J6Z0B5_9RHOB|nr:YeeE/YedE thiosulfate transporter family protein [Mangrovicoccus algicola]MBE3639203.1 YeeE/YedE family protein [Mangrovicoccus algicola]